MLVNVLSILQIIIEISIFGYFFYVASYNLIFSVFGFRKVKVKIKSTRVKKKIVVLVPAFKEDNVILNSVASNLEIDYPKNLFQIVVIADSLGEETMIQLQRFPIKLITVSFEESTKVKSIKSALNYLENDYDIMVILDADNIVERDFLMIVNDLYCEGDKIVQGRRLIKNPSNSLAFLDDLSEQINNHIFRKGAFNLGCSSSIAGSGFAIDYQLGVEIFDSLDSVGGFDKEFELKLLNMGFATPYYEELITYDEKIETDQVFKQQRKRWISSQYWVLIKYFNTGIRALINGDFVYFNSAILRNLQLPRLINLGLFTLIMVSIIFFMEYIFVPFYAWIICYGAFLISILIAIPKRFYNFKLVLSIFKLPGIFITMFLILFKLKGTNQKFIHTPHNSQLSNND